MRHITKFKLATTIADLIPKAAITTRYVRVAMVTDPIEEKVVTKAGKKRVAEHLAEYYMYSSRVCGTRHSGKQAL